MLPQCKTEELLAHHLMQFNHNVERNIDLINVEQRDNQVIATIKHGDKKIETITFDWLIACDGANSVVRDKCQMAFPGEDILEEFVVADANIDSFMSDDEVHLFFDNNSLFAAFPLGSDNYRITANLLLPNKHAKFTENEVMEMAHERAYGAYYVKTVSWISPFWIHGNVVKHMRDGSIFLVGDAAHIHSPAGGQGMNTGIQDAYNLAWKLSLVIKNQAKLSLLDSYHEERYPIIKEVVKNTNDYTKMALFEPSFLDKLRFFKDALSKNEITLSKIYGEKLTQLDINYKDSSIIHHKHTHGEKVKAGSRAPNVILDLETRLYDFLRNTNHNILLFTGFSPTKSDINEIFDTYTSLNKIFPGLITTSVVSQEQLPDIKHVIHDKGNKIHSTYGITKPELIVIRPDTYIAYSSDTLNVNLVHAFLNQYLNG
jgi:flavin-dependent dehydrogenase